MLFFKSFLKKGKKETFTVTAISHLCFWKPLPKTLKYHFSKLLDVIRYTKTMC